MAEDTDAKSFTSWKMDWINALMIGVEPRDFRVAVCLLQHANSRTKLIMPAQARVGTLLGCSVDTVERAVSRLVKGGWLEKSRANRQRSNRYQFVEAKRMAMIDLRQHREDTWEVKRRKSDTAELPVQDRADPAILPVSEPAELRAPDTAELPGKHLKGTPEGNTLIQGHDKYTELSIGQYARGHEEELAQRAPQERRSKQALPALAFQQEPHRGESRGMVGTKPYVPPNFDSLDFELHERQAKARRRGMGQ